MARRARENVVALNSSVESDEAVHARIAERFEVLNEISQSVLMGVSRALIVSGSPGVGKSFTIVKALEEHDPEQDTWTVIKGFTRATGLLKTLYQYRHPGNIIVFDDCDSVFSDDVGLNLLKAVVDTTDRRRVSWLSEARFLDDETGETIPRHFDFEGSIIFLTNLDFDAMIAKGHKIAPHLEALISRAFYLDLTLKTTRDKLARVRALVEDGMLSDLDIEQQADVLTFVEVHSHRIRELSLRVVNKLAQLRKSNNNWEKIAKITLCRN